jgi:PDZ domain-containing protein
MHELGIPVPTTLTVAGFSPGSDAEEALAEGDVVLAVDGYEVPDLPQLRDRMQQVDPGDPVTVRVERDGAPVEVEVTTTRGPEGETLLGVLIDPRYEFPFDVSIQIEDIGGPSAGMMFALGIVDKLTPGAMTGGVTVAGTGTISAQGEVGPIGGIRQKMWGAREAGAAYFLAPVANCDEVAGHAPDGLRVIAVNTLGEAVEALDSVAAGGGAGLPGCASDGRAAGQSPSPGS